MEALKPLRGLIIDLVTPLKPNGAIDGRGLGQHLDRVLPHVQAVYIASPYVGEGNHLEPAQREELLDKTLVVTRGRVPVMVWISGPTEDDTRETLFLLQKRVEARKYSGLLYWIDTPLRYHSNRGLLSHYQRLMAFTQAPFLLHNDPEFIQQLGQPLKRTNIRTSILKQLIQLEGIQGLIYVGPFARAYHYQKAVRSRTDFRLYDGDETHFLNHPSLSGVVSAGANLAPRAWQKVTESSLQLSETLDEYPDSVHQLWEAGEYIRKLRDLYRATPTTSIKKALSSMGIIQSPTSLSKSDDVGEQAEELITWIERQGDLP